MNPVVMFIAGLIIGMALIISLVITVMRTRMVVAHRSGRTFEDTCATIEKVVGEAKGWGFPIETWNFYETFAKKNLVPKGFVKLKVYFVCNSALASRLIEDTPSFVGMMPCSWAVYEMEDGQVYLSKMNVGLMSMMFSGVPGASMKEVGRVDDIFLAEVLHPDRQAGNEAVTADRRVKAAS